MLKIEDLSGLKELDLNETSCLGGMNEIDPDECPQRLIAKFGNLFPRLMNETKPKKIAKLEVKMERLVEELAPYNFVIIVG